jgi:hypothetical protein
MAITPIEQYIATELAKVFGPQDALTGLIGLAIISAAFFIARPPISVALTAVGIMAVVFFGTFMGVDESATLGTSPYMLSILILGLVIIAYLAYKRVWARDY